VSLRLRLSLLVAAVNAVFWAAMLAWFAAEGRRIREDYEEAGRARTALVRDTALAQTVRLIEIEIADVVRRHAERKADPALLPIELQKRTFWDSEVFRRYVRKATVVRIGAGERGPREFFNPRSDLVFDRGALEPKAAAELVSLSLWRDQPEFEKARPSRVAGPIRVGGEPWGGLYLSLEDPDAEIRRYDPLRLLGDVATIAALGTLASIAALYRFLARDVLRPLEDLSGVAAAFAEGDVSRRAAELDRGDELGRTVAAFNRMLGLVQDYRANMERRVGEQLETIQQKNRELALAQRLAATGTLAAGVAHEINNPLGGMLNAVGRLKKPGISEESRAKYLEILDENVERIGAIVRRLLDLSPRRAEPGDVDLADAARRTVELVRYRADKQGVKLVVEAGEGVPRVRGDRHELTQAVLNLVINALDAVAAGGAIRIRTAADGAYARLEVVDDGAGMPPEVQARAFDLFFTTKEAGKGTGLGLAAVHHAVTSAGGEIAVESAPGRGTTVRLRLPAAAPPDGGGAKPA
jgi:signal transduction histidine kinase